ncbi:Serine-protein kinase ATM, partial [Stegodyphus mimosarum]
MLSVLEEFSEAYLDAQALKNLLNKWQFQDQIAYDDFEYVEPVSWLKCVLLTHCVCSNQNKPTILPKLKKLLEKYAVRARKELFLEVASSAVNALRKLPCVEDDDTVRWQIEEAKILWTKKEYSIASKILKSTLHRMEKIAKENSNILMCYGEALTLRGRWLAETCNENSVVIMQEYLEKAVNVLKDIESDNSSTSTSSSCAIWDAYFAVARYADGQYQSIMNYKKSTAYQMKQVLMHSSKEEARKLKSKDNNEDQRKTHVIMAKQSLIDQEEMAALEADQKKFLEKAIINYLKCLCGTDTHDVWIFRLISLWFENLSHKEINQIISDEIKDLQSYKFLPLMYQLAARMGTQASALFTNTLTQLIKRITIDHPHHALPVILALSNADKDPVETRKVSTQTALLQQAEVPSVKERMNAAKKIISHLQKSKISSILKSYSDLCDAYISLAYLPVDKETQ